MNNRIIITSARSRPSKLFAFKQAQLSKYVVEFFQQESGQAVTEYGALIAFVSLLLAMVFSTSHGGLSQAMSSAMGQLVNNLNTLSRASAS
jgi:Flp pilus assembly pilin Flp